MKGLFHKNITALLFFIGVLYYMMSLIYHSCGVFGDNYWDCFFFIKDAVIILALLFIVYENCTNSASIFMVLSIFIYKLGCTIADVWGCLNCVSFEKYGMFLTSVKVFAPVSVLISLILLFIIKIYRLWTN